MKLPEKIFLELSVLFMLATFFGLFTLAAFLVVLIPLPLIIHAIFTDGRSRRRFRR